MPKVEALAYVRGDHGSTMLAEWSNRSVRGKKFTAFEIFAVAVGWLARQPYTYRSKSYTCAFEEISS